MLGTNKLVVHYSDGRVFKGSAADFRPNKDKFHLRSLADPKYVKEVYLKDLKAVFFVKDFEGDPSYEPRKSFEQVQAPGKKLKVKFRDGETLVGTTQAYHPNRVGFFIIPVDPDENTIRAFVVNGFVESVEQIG